MRVLQVLQVLQEELVKSTKCVQWRLVKVLAADSCSHALLAADMLYWLLHALLAADIAP